MKKVSFGLIAPLSMVFITILSGALLMSIKVKADDSIVDKVKITVPVSCTMSGIGMDSHTATVRNNEYTQNIGTTTLHAFCNDTNGFAIYAAGYTGDEIGGENSTKLIGTPATIGNINTGTAISGSTSNWAMKLAVTQDSGNTTGTNAVTIDNNFNTYHIVPNEYTKVAHKNTATDMTASTGGVKLTTTYAAFMSQNQPAGTYAGKVIYTLVHPASEVPVQPQNTASGQICYYANASDAIGAMGCQNVASSVTLLASNFSRTGYGFAGWSDAYDYASNPNANFYGPQETISLTPADYQSPNKGLSLYAVWVKSNGSLQGWSGCSGLTKADTATNILTQSITALTDQRDNNTYAIARLADGKCWMIENLRLESTNSDNRTGTLAQGYGGQFEGLADAEPAWANNITTANSLYYSGTQDGTATINIGTGDNPGYRFPRYNHDNTNSRASNPTTNSNAMYSYGNYYTWPAAIADTTNYTTNNQSVTNTSLCPAGWRLPQGGNKTRIESNDDNDFWNLTVDALNGSVNPANYDSSATPYYTGTAEAGPVANKLRSYPNNFVYSGGVYSGSVGSRGSYGGYWSSTAYSSGNAYYLYLNSSSVYPGTRGSIKYLGRTVRCVAGV